MTAPLYDWLEEAACRDMDTELFFPRTHSAAAYQSVRPVCEACPVAAECLTDALVYEIQRTRQGMRGGLTPRERDEEYKRRLKAGTAPERKHVALFSGKPVSA